MKKFLTSILLLCSVLTLSAQSLVMKVTLTDGTSKEFAVSEIQGIAFDQEPYVDLGLESGVKWATINVGATSETDPGTPYKWDEAESVIKNEWTKQYGDKEWRMPTKEEIDELIKTCDWSEYKDAEGKAVGYKVAKKGNENLFIILPFAQYWSRSAYDSEIAWYLRVDAGHVDIKRQEMVEQLCIRPVWGKPIVTATIETGTPDVDYSSATIPVKVSSESDIEVASYGVKYSTHADMSGATILSGSGKLSANTFKDVLIEDLQPGTTYYYQAFAELTTPALSLLSEPIASFTTRAKELTVTAEVSYKTSTAATLDLGFTGNVRGTIYYKVLYGQDKNLVEDTEATLKIQGTWELTSAGTTQYDNVNLLDLEPGKTYYYRVIAKYADFEATPVSGNFVTDSQDITVTASTKAVGATTATVSVSLTSNVLPCQVTYYVEYGLDELLQNSSKTSERTVTLTSATGQTVDVELSGLKEGETYYYHVVAKIGDSLVRTSAHLSFSTISKTLTVSASAYATSATTAQASLTFKGNVTGSGKYKLLYGEDDNLDQQLPSGEFTINRADIPVTQYIGLSNLKPNQKYSVQLVAGYDDALNVSSDIETFQTPAKTLKITSVSASNITAKAATILIQLSANSVESVSYEVKYSKNEDMTDALKKGGNIQLETSSGETISVGIDQLEEQTTYYYQVTVCYTTDTSLSDAKSDSFKTPEKVTYVAPAKVDLGCSVLWGSFNLGAKDETSRGGFFGWGDPTGEKVSQYESYGNAGLTPPVDLTTSHQELDIVHVTLEDNWHTPTAAQMLELMEKCTWTHVQNYKGSGIDGYIVTGKGNYAENSIFIPCSGYRSGVDNDGNIIMSANSNEAYYWSSQLTDSPWRYGIFVKLQKGTVKSEKALTFYGMHIRPVYGEGGTPEIPNPDEDHSLEVADTINGMIVPVDGVDLGLSVKWAGWNVGATDTMMVNNKAMGVAGQCGGYYSWGETSTKERYSYADYTLNLTERILAPEHDAASVNWGDDWRMPTEDEWDELVLNCTVTWETVTWKTADGTHYTQGYRYTSKKPGYTDRSIFLPAGGVDSGSGPFGKDLYGYYWSSSKHLTLPNDAVCLLFSSDGTYNDPSSRYERFGGLLIRPVKPIAKKE